MATYAILNQTNINEMYREDIINKLKSYDSKFDEEKINKAIDFAIHYHGNQTRASGDPYYNHPLEVASIIVSMKLDSDSVITALLHDTVEDTELTLDDIKQHFGSEVTKLVDGVTKLSKIELEPEHVRQAENFRKLLLAISQDIRVLLVKLADRLHNMRTIDFIQSPEKKMRIALETMEIYAPLAERIGIQKIKTELQDISFRILYPSIRHSILDSLENLSVNEEQFINNVVSAISEKLKDSNINARIYGRRKTPYSIWMKMQQKNIRLEQLSDIIAFRIILNNVADCYATLGVIHTEYKMIPNTFQDFISMPKNNGYQSLHTVVIGPLQQKIEIQIRTQEMHQVAEFGVAAHWKYKQKYLDHEQDTQYTWINELLTILEDLGDPEEFLKNTKLAMYYDQVFCFTPKGNIIALPRGATVIDFAYAVHSDIGHRCIGAKINGHILPINTILNNGDQVEILTSDTQTPSLEWEQYITTGKARSEIKKFTKEQKKSQYISLGKVILKKILQDNEIQENALTIKKLLENFNKSHEDELYSAIAEGIISRKDIIKNLSTKSNTLPNFFRSKTSPSTNTNTLPIKGLLPGMAIHYSDCCNPIPGDKIVGILQMGQGVTVHTAECHTLVNYNLFQEDLIALCWDDHNSKECKNYRLEITIVNEVGNLAMITSELAKHRVNIINLKVISRTEEFFKFHIDVSVDKPEKINNITNYFKALKSVLNIKQTII